MPKSFNNLVSFAAPSGRTSFFRSEQAVKIEKEQQWTCTGWTYSSYANSPKGWPFSAGGVGLACHCQVITQLIQLREVFNWKTTGFQLVYIVTKLEAGHFLMSMNLLHKKYICTQVYAIYEPLWSCSFVWAKCFFSHVSRPLKQHISSHPQKKHGNPCNTKACQHASLVIGPLLN